MPKLYKSGFGETTPVLEKNREKQLETNTDAF
jgi:hypothetical protein